jgi:hypothetical protein
VPHPEIARMLLELGAEVNARIDGRMSIEAAIDALSLVSTRYFNTAATARIEEPMLLRALRFSRRRGRVGIRQIRVPSARFDGR